MRLGSWLFAAIIASTGYASPAADPFKSIFNQAPMPLPRYQQLDAPLMGNGDMAVAVSGDPDDQEFWLSKNDLWELRNVWCLSGPRPFGHLDIKIPQLHGASYRAEQDLTTGTTTETFDINASQVTMRSWVCAVDNLLVVELSNRGVEMDGDVRLWIPAHARTTPQSDHRSKPGTAPDWDGFPAAPIFTGQAGIYWGVRAFREQVAIPAEVACAFRVLGGDGTHFHLKPGAPVLLVAAMRSLRQSSHYTAEVQSRVATLDRATVQTKLYDEHKKWWRNFWDKSSVALGDPELEWRYHVSNYILASCSRDPDYPPGIAGTWVTTDQPMWTGAYTLNYNHVACFYGLYSSNHIEQADPEDAPILDFRERGEYYAREVLHCRGVLYPVKIGPVGIETTRDEIHPDIVVKPDDAPWLRQKGGLFLGQRSDAAFSAINIAQRWYTTYDPAYGRKVYPFIRDVALFWEDYLKFEPTPPELIAATKDLPAGLRQPPDGRYISYNDGANEGGQDTNPALSLGMAQNALRLAIDLSVSLGINERERGKWQYILDHLSAFPTQEYNGVTIFKRTEKNIPETKKAAESTPPKLAVRPDSTYIHIYPANAVGLGSDPRLLQVARNTLNAKPTWVDMNGTSAFYPAAARVGFDPNALLAKLHEMRFQPNGVVYNEFHMLENSSIVPNTVDEMLLQSFDGTLRLFPVWPANHDASFRTLRAYGAFLVSAELKGGVVTHVSIFSEQGRPCVVQNPWPGRRVSVRCVGKPDQTLAGERLSFKTGLGDQMELVVASEAQ